MSADNKHLTENSDKISSAKSTESFFWFCGQPFFEPMVYFLPNQSEVRSGQGQEEDQSYIVNAVKIFDCDGVLVNEAEVSFPNNKLGWIEIEPLIAGCKLDSGIKHGCLQINSNSALQHKLGLLSETQPLLLTPLKRLVKGSNEFFPIYAKKNSQVFLGIANVSDKEIAIRIKLIDQSKAPEVDLKIPAFASKIISISDIFQDAIQADMREDALSYLRCNVKSDGVIAYNIFDVEESRNKINFKV